MTQYGEALPSPERDGSGLPVTIENPLRVAGADEVLANRPFTLTTTAVADAVSIPRTQLGFQARTLRVDNFSGQWFYVPAAQQWVPPYTFGIVIRLPLVEMADVRAVTPPGAGFTSTPLAGQQPIFTYEATRFEPNGGTAITSAAQSKGTLP